MARPRAGGRRHPARVGALDVRLRRTAATTNGARAGSAAHRRARLRFRVLAGRAGSSRADRASDARMSGARKRGPMRQSRLGRGAALARLALRIGGRYLARSPRLIFASVERRGELRHELALRTADDVVEELGSMKGALMKLGQMASYIDEDMPETFRKAMGRLQHNAPPMSPELASSVIVEELGAAPERVFARWDTLPLPAPPVGQMHRAITLDGKAVAVKVQYPGIARTITSDVKNVSLLRRGAPPGFKGLEPRSLIDSLGGRPRRGGVDRRDAGTPEVFARYFDGHPGLTMSRLCGVFG